MQDAAGVNSLHCCQIQTCENYLLREIVFLSCLNFFGFVVYILCDENTKSQKAQRATNQIWFTGHQLEVPDLYHEKISVQIPAKSK